MLIQAWLSPKSFIDFDEEAGHVIDAMDRLDRAIARLSLYERVRQNLVLEHGIAQFCSIGAEAQLEWRGASYSIEGIAALVRSNDPAGELLAARGWSLSDLTSGLGSRVREPDVYALANGVVPPLRFNPFLENDGRLGWYAGGTWRAPGRGRISLLRYDNEADPATHSGGASPVFSWHTKFWSLGAEADAGRLVLLAQAMSGSTEIALGPQFSTTTDFRAAYCAGRLESWRVARGVARRRVLDRTVATQPCRSHPRARQRRHLRTELATAPMATPERRMAAAA